jgi:hypothetical protein
MTDLPIIMSGPMVRALLREIEKPGTGKTQTRRLAWRVSEPADEASLLPERRQASPWQRVKPGDRLWVREAFRPHGDGPLSECTGPADFQFAATADEASIAIFKWRSPIHMPRWASRLTLIVTATKIEPLQKITPADAMAEGVEQRADRDYQIGRDIQGTDPIACFSALWWSLHGIGAWDKNPEVIALTFTVIKANIDAVEARAA